jgi:hypothetical protein
MLGIVLLYVGAVLFVNGFSLLGLADAKGAAVMNFLTGILSLTINIIIIAVNAVGKGDPALYYAAGTGLLFAFTYLYVGAVNMFGLDGRGLGWYCLYVAITALPASYLAFGSDPRFGVIWLIWAFLWFVYFLLLALKLEIVKFAGYATILIAVVTGWIPGFLLLAEKW